MTWSLAFLGTSYRFCEKKMRNVFVTVITITINNSKLEGYWTLQATGLLLQLPKRLAFVIFNHTILLLTLLGN